MLAVDLLWIVLGTSYVIYKLHKEEKVFTKERVCVLLSIAAFLFIPQILVSLICDEDSLRLARPIVALVVTILPMLGLCIYGLFSSVSSEYQSKKEKDFNTRAMHSTQELRKVFESHGFYNIPTQTLEALRNDPLSPIKTYGVTGSTWNICYQWMCEYESTKINELSHNMLSEKLGVPIDIIPLDPTLPEDKAMWRRISLVKDKILRQCGLHYVGIGKYFEKDEYCQQFNVFVDAHRKQDGDSL